MSGDVLRCYQDATELNSIVCRRHSTPDSTRPPSFCIMLVRQRRCGRRKCHRPLPSFLPVCVRDYGAAAVHCFGSSPQESLNYSRDMTRHCRRRLLSSGSLILTSGPISRRLKKSTTFSLQNFVMKKMPPILGNVTGTSRRLPLPSTSPGYRQHLGLGSWSG